MEYEITSELHLGTNRLCSRGYRRDDFGSRPDHHISLARPGEQLVCAARLFKARFRRDLALECDGCGMERSGVNAQRDAARASEPRRGTDAKEPKSKGKMGIGVGE